MCCFAFSLKNSTEAFLQSCGMVLDPRRLLVGALPAAFGTEEIPASDGAAGGLCEGDDVSGLAGAVEVVERGRESV